MKAGWVAVWLRSQDWAVSVDDAVHCGGPVSPAIGALLLWHWGLWQRIWDTVAEHYNAKGRNGQAGLGSTAVKHVVLVGSGAGAYVREAVLAGSRPGAGLEEPAQQVCAILANREFHSQAGG